MEDKATLIESLFEKAENYGTTSLELFKLKTVEKVADTASSFSSHLAFVAAYIFGLLILSIGAALWLGELLGKSYYGFFIVAGLYALIGLILYALRYRFIKTAVKNSIITEVLN